jgi:ketosteroid isomerase-like protein
MPVSEEWLAENVRDDRHRELLRRIVAGDERLDAAAFVQVLTDDASLRFGSSPPLAGKAAIAQAVAGFFSQLAAFRHDLHVAWESPGMLAYEAEVTYRTRDGRELRIPYANVLRLRGALVCDYRIYIDLAPLYQTAIDQGSTP